MKYPTNKSELLRFMANGGKLTIISTLEAVIRTDEKNNDVSVNFIDQESPIFNVTRKAEQVRSNDIILDGGSHFTLDRWSEKDNNGKEEKADYSFNDDILTSYIIMSRSYSEQVYKMSL